MNEQSREQQHSQLRKIAESHLPPTMIILAYMEHQMDITAKVVDDLVTTLKEGGALDNMSVEQLERVENLRGLLRHSSVDFDNITDPTQSYKIPKAIDNKETTRVVQDMYLRAQQDRGILD